MKFKDYYKILGVDPSADQGEIKSAYRKLARKYHPDVSKESNAEDRFKEVGEAYEALKDKEKRQAYDQVRNGGFRQGDEFRPPPGWQGNQGGGFRTEDLSGFSDFFSSLFGGGFEGGFGGRRQPQRSSRQPGQDQSAKIQIDLETAFEGGTRRITLNRPTQGPGGAVQTQGQELEVKIPAGVTEGQKIRLRGQGQPGQHGGPAGDLLLEIGFKKHRQFEVDGRHISLQLPIAPWEAALGAQINVPTLSSKIRLTIPAGSSSGKRFRLKGRGLPGSPSGDQFVILKIVVPEAKTERQRELYRELESEYSFDPRASV